MSERVTYMDAGPLKGKTGEVLEAKRGLLRVQLDNGVIVIAPARRWGKAVR